MRSIAAFLLLLGGCGADNLLGPDAGAPDLTIVFNHPDLASPDPCAVDGGCTTVSFGLPGAFPLQSDPMPPPNERDQSIERDGTGALGVALSRPAFFGVWIANGADAEGGTVSRFDARTVREVARYPSVTCSSLPGGSTAACDGTKGCCALDDWNRYQARKAKMPAPGAQPVQRTQNLPSRTTVEESGDVYVANRASGGQSSVTRIAARLADCVDRNGNGRIDTSSDSDGNGVIDTDCNGDHLPDDIATVKSFPCFNGKPQEYYGLDDECVLWTTNLFPAQADVRALARMPGAGPSQLWAGSSTRGAFVRVDGATGRCTADIELPNRCYQAAVFGLAIDDAGIGWTAPLGPGSLCYFDAGNPDNRATDAVRDPTWGKANGWSIAVDPEQDIWLAGEVARYRPDRSRGFASLGNGRWMRVAGLNGVGVAADARSPATWFLYACTGSGAVQIPASVIPAAPSDQIIPNPGWPLVRLACLSLGVDADQNLWGVETSHVTRARIGADGTITQPMTGVAPMGMNRCPAGDSCETAPNLASSDYTGFAPQFAKTRSATYQLIVSGCRDPQSGAVVDTEWRALTWETDVAAGAKLVVRAASSTSGTIADPAWSLALDTVESSQSPLDLQASLTPNLHSSDPPGTIVNDPFLRVTVEMTSNANAEAKLKRLGVTYRCR